MVQSKYWQQRQLRENTGKPVAVCFTGSFESDWSKKKGWAMLNQSLTKALRELASTLKKHPI